MVKRERLVHAVTHNIKYLAKLHETNAELLRTTTENLIACEKFNAKLQMENNALIEERDRLQKFQKELDQKRKEMTKMAIESQANKAEIEQLNDAQEGLMEKMEKLNLEVTVVITEKLSLKKEYTRIDQ